MRVFALAATACLCLAVSACATEPGVPGEIISNGAQPYSETWDQMRQRDKARLAAGLESPPVVIEAPRGDFPPIVPEGYTPSQEGGPPPPVGTISTTIDTNFTGITLQDQFNAFGVGSIPPDTMGAVGPDHFMVVINSSVAIYNRTGTRLSHVALDTFFTVNVGGTIYPRNGSFDTRVRYDARSGRWFATALEFGNPVKTNNHIILAVCRTADPTTGVWDRYVIPVGVASGGGHTYFSDYDTLGIDDNGVYFAVRIFPSSGSSYAKIVATGKASLIAATPSLGAVSQWSSITDMYSTPQPAHNLDASASNRAWFVSSDPTAYANIRYRTLTWSGGTPTLTGTSTLSTPAFAAPMDAPASGSTTNIDINDMRLQCAAIRGSRLWTCRNVGVNSSGGSSGADRTGCEWMEIDVTSATASLVQSGRVYDTAATNPWFYYYPSIMVNGAGTAVMGFSGSSATQFIGGYCCCRLAGDPAGAMGPIATVHAGQASYTRLDTSSRNRWGDYSYTTLDPNDGASIWTIQEYATNIGSSIWGTWIARTTPGFRILAYDTPFSGSDIPAIYEFHVTNGSWTAVGIDPGASDHDVRADNTIDFSSPYAASTYTGLIRDFIVTNGNTWADANHFAQVYYGSSGAYTIEADVSGAELAVNSMYSAAMGTGEVLDVYEANLAAGAKYTLNLEIPSGGTDGALWVYAPTQSDGTRSSAAWWRNAAGIAADEVLVFTPGTSGSHGIVVTNENAGLSLYTIGIGVTPANDERAGSTNISSLPYAIVQDTRFATTAADDPATSCGAQVHSRSVWYKLTLATTASVTADTLGSDYDTVLVVFTDQGGLNQVTCNDDYNPPTVRQSQVSWDAVGGVTYYIEITTYGSHGEGGSLHLNVAYVPPDNDDCSNATVLSGLDGGATQSTLGATKAGNEPTPLCVSAIYNTVWFSVTPAANGTAVFSTSGSDYDTVLAVYRGTCGGLMQYIACSDDAIGSPPGSRYSALAFNAEAGITYLVQVGGYHNYDAGNLHLRYSLGPECMTISEAKQAGIGARVSLCGKIVESPPASNPVGMTFIEEPDRTMGIALSSDFGGLAAGTSVTVVGITYTTSQANLCLNPGTMAGVGADIARRPVGMTNKAVGGSAFFYQRGVTGASGLNNIGLYVRVWGEVKSIDTGSHTYWIDDGSNLSYQPGHTGLAVLYQGSPPILNAYVYVTGFPWLWDPVQTPIVIEVSRQ